VRESNKQIAFRKLPGDEIYLQALAEEWGIGYSAIMRLAIRFLAKELGVLDKTTAAALKALRDLVNEQSPENVERARKVLILHDAKFKRILKLSPYPIAIERELLEAEKRNHRRRQVARPRPTP
jgi:hypothetical protein